MNAIKIAGRIGRVTSVLSYATTKEVTKTLWFSGNKNVTTRLKKYLVCRKNHDYYPPVL